MAKGEKANKGDGKADRNGSKSERSEYDPDKDVMLAEHELNDKFTARVMRYDGLEEGEDGETKEGTPKLVVYKKGRQGKEFTPKRIPWEVALLLEKAIAKFRKDGVVE